MVRMPPPLCADQEFNHWKAPAMFNTATPSNTAPASLGSTLFAIIEMLLMVDLRDELVAENQDAQVDGGYQYGL
jgi:hypothetical protein